MSIGKLTSGPATVAYYVDQVANGRDDYYAGQREQPGRWVGVGAAELGWGDEVDAEQFAHLLAGAGERRIRDGGVAGFDLTFRAPKSVSVLWAIGDDDLAAGLHAAHDEAVERALAFLEREGAWGRRGHGGLVQSKGVGFVAAAFTHHASRAGDPLLHTHVVVGNLTRGDDGRWTALDARHLYRLAKTAGFLYQAELRFQITDRLGLEWTVVENGVADLVGVPREVIEHFSQRRAEILAHMAEHGAWSPEAAQVAALETRRAKNEPPLERQREDWRSRAAEYGLTDQDLQRLLDRPPVRVALPAGIVIESLTDHASTFSRADVLRALAEAQPTGATIAELEVMADVILTDPSVVLLADRDVAGAVGVRFTTRELLAIEHDLIEESVALVGTDAGVVDDGAVQAALAGRSLTDEQITAVIALCEDGDGVSVVRAAAGTGKTFALDAAREAWRLSGIDVVGTALSARAALELHDQTAIPTRTITQTRWAIEHGEALPECGVLVVDEAGMVGTRDLANLADAARRSQTKLVLVGDDRQLAEIQAGGAFHALAEELEAAELHTVLRQREAWDRDALKELRSGEVERWASAYRERGNITIGRNAEQTRAALVNDWAEAGGDRLIIAQRRDDVRDLNQRVRELRQDRGDLSRDELEIGDRAFAVGDEVIGLRNDRRRGIVNGQRGRVTDIDKQRETVTVELEGDTSVELAADYLTDGLDHGYAITAHRAQGMTVDRTFVLGSDRTSREWGYTAMSRHRDEARFYATRDQIDTDLDLPPEVDWVVAGVSRMMERSDQKQLALESLQDVDRDRLAKERSDLRDRLTRDRPPADREYRLDADIEHAREALEDAIQREAAGQKRRAELAWYERRARADCDRTLELNREAIEHHADRLDQAVAARDEAHGLDQRWLAEHGPDAERLLAVDDELQSRDAVDDAVTRSLHAYELEPSHDLEPPGAADRLDHGLDYTPYEPLPQIGIDPPGPDLDLDFGP